MKIIFLFIALLGLSSIGSASFSPLSVGLVPPLEFPPNDFNIVGARISLIYGKQRDVFGLDLGLVGNTTDGSFGGTAFSGVFNYNKGDVTVLGLQAAGGVNINANKTHVYGLQLAGLANINNAESSVTGLQLALANVSEHTQVYGFQVGVYNRAQDVYGFQIGLVNVATNLHGVQIGLLNFNRTGLLAVSPILNVGF